MTSTQPVSSPNSRHSFLAGCAAILAGLAVSTTIPSVVRAANCGAMASDAVDWSGCNKRNLILQGSSFEKANLSDADLALTDLSASNLSEAVFHKASLARASLAGAKALKSDFSRVEAYRTIFTGMAASDANFASAELQRSTFEGSTLQNANFEKAELARVNFRKTDLSGARFAYANLSRADLTGITANAPMSFDHAFLFLTRIQGVDLTTSTGLEQSQIDLACGDKTTRLPKGLTAPSSWPCNLD